MTKTIAWADLCGFAEHPARDELRPYLDWKLKHSTIKPLSPAIGTTAAARAHW